MVAASFAASDTRVVASLRRVCITPSVKHEIAVARMDVRNTKRRDTIRDSKFGS
jgi:hypothetical protein